MDDSTVIGALACKKEQTIVLISVSLAKEPHAMLFTWESPTVRIVGGREDCHDETIITTVLNLHTSFDRLMTPYEIFELIPLQELS